MGFWAWMGRVVGLPDTPREEFSGDDVTVWSPYAGPVDHTVLSLASRLHVGRAEALAVPTVLKGRNLLCSISTLPMGVVDADNRTQRHSLFEQFDPNVPNVVHLALTVEDLIFESIAWWRVTGRGFDGYPTSAERLDPSRVTIDPAPGRLQPTPSGVPVGRAVRVDGRVTPYADLIRFDSPNPALLVAGREAIQRALLLKAAAAMYAGSPPPREFFRARDGMDPEDQGEIDEFLNDWAAARRRGVTAYVPEWVEREDAGGLTPAELQLAELGKAAGLDIANAMGIDPEELGISTTSRTYANDVDRRRNKINDVYSAYMCAITHRLSMGDVTKRTNRVVFKIDDYMKANPTERVNYYKGMKDMGVMDVDEIRQAEVLPPRTDTDAPAGADGGTGTVTPLPARGVAATRRTGHGFADDGKPQTFSFNASVGHTFSVDAEKRVITGLALPYGVVVDRYWGKVTFDAGCIEYTDVGRVKHYMNHVTPVGRAIDLSDSDTALTAKLSVKKGAVGDELLSDAQEGIYDGLSVGVDFSINPEDGDVYVDDDGVYHVARATLREISTTAMPQFDDARVTKVAASRTHGGITMQKCTKCHQEHAPTVACPQTPPSTQDTNLPEGFTTEDVEKFQKLAEMFGMEAKLPEKLSTGPTVVDPTTFGRKPAKVTEAAPYRFDRRGNLLAGTHDFSADLVAAQRGDKAATDRATEFVKEQFAIQTGDVNELNPAQNRPEMYVDQREYPHPLWDAVNKGTLANITPFYFPKFNSASGLVGNHTEMVEPTPGTFTTTSQTVTPSAVSGKVEISRETWDQGGSPQVSNLIWQKMLQGWYEALEAYAVALLDAVTPIPITLTAGAQDGALVDELTLALAKLQFVRGGFRMDTAFTQVDLYSALVAATDTAGRKLLPALNPANADGTARARWSGLDVNGQAFLPAWALAASGTVAASSYLFDPGSVHAWASTPQRLEFQYQVKSVEIGIWGYKAGAVSDLSGIREIIYDPTA